MTFAPVVRAEEALKSTENTLSVSEDNKESSEEKKEESVKTEADKNEETSVEKEEKKEESEENKTLEDNKKAEDKKEEPKETKKIDKKELTEEELKFNYVFDDGTVKKPEGWVEVTLDAGSHCGFYVHKNRGKHSPIDKFDDDVEAVKTIKLFVKKGVPVEIYKSEARKYMFGFTHDKEGVDATKFELKKEYAGLIKGTFDEDKTIVFEYQDHPATMGGEKYNHYFTLTKEDGSEVSIDVSNIDKGSWNSKNILYHIDEIRKNESDNTIGWELDYGQDEKVVDGKKIPKVDAKRILVLGLKYKDLESNLMDITNDGLYDEKIVKFMSTNKESHTRKLNLKEIVKKENERTVMVVEPTENGKYRLISFKVYGEDYKLNKDDNYNYSLFDLKNKKKLGEIDEDTKLNGDIIILQERIGVNYEDGNYTPAKRKVRPRKNRVNRPARGIRFVKSAKKYAILNLNNKSFNAGNKAENIDIMPIIKDGNVFIPLKYVAASYGFELNWEKENELFTLTKNGKKIVIPTSGNVIYVNDEPIILDSNIEFKDGNIYLSIENIIKALGLYDGDIVWDEKNKEIKFSIN